MSSFLLLALMIAVLALDQAWNRRRVRAYYAQLGRRVLAIRWRPLGGLLDWGVRRGDHVYHVVHVGLVGEARASRCITGFWSGVRVDEDLGAAQRPGAARSTTRLVPPSRRDHAAPRAFWPVCAGNAVLACVSIGASYWSLPYRSVNLPSSLWVPGLLLVPIAAAALAWWQPKRFWWIAAVQTAGVVAVVALRIAADLARDPTSHNLFPFEIAIALLAGGFVAVAGAFVGWIGRRFVDG